MPEPRPQRDRSSRDERIAALDVEIAAVHEALKPLHVERRALTAANAREDWPDGPFTLYYWQYRSQETDEYDTPQEALRAAESMEDYGTASTEKIVDRHGTLIYDLKSYRTPSKVAGYPDPRGVLA